jgi:outer membrane lipoprotein-sorting protein
MPTSMTRQHRALANVILAALLGCSSLGAGAEPLSAEQIVHRTNFTSYYQGKSGRAQVSMTITDSQQRVRQRELTILRLDASDSDNPDDGSYQSDQKFYLYFKRPADVNKMVFLVWKHLASDDDRWLYLPDMDLVKRIAASDQRTSFVGSDYFYEDVSGRSLEADRHELTGSDGDYYIINNTPLAPEQVEFSRYEMYIHKSTFIPVQTTYFDKQGEPYRIATALAVSDIEGYPTVTSAKMQDLRSGSTTVMNYTAVDYNVELDDELFTERYLRRPPLRHLR